PLLGGLAHPLEAADAVGEGGEDLVGELLVALLGPGREVLLHVELAERVAEVALLLVEHPLPARPLLGSAVEDGAVEVEGLGVEPAARLGGELVRQMPPEIRLPVGESARGERLLELLEELRLADDHGVDGLELSLLQELAPADRG